MEEGTIVREYETERVNDTMSFLRGTVPGVRVYAYAQDMSQPAGPWVAALMIDGKWLDTVQTMGIYRSRSDVHVALHILGELADAAAQQR